MAFPKLINPLISIYCRYKKIKAQQTTVETMKWQDLGVLRLEKTFSQR